MVGISRHVSSQSIIRCHTSVQSPHSSYGVVLPPCRPDSSPWILRSLGVGMALHGGYSGVILQCTDNCSELVLMNNTPVQYFSSQWILRCHAKSVSPRAINVSTLITCLYNIYQFNSDKHSNDYTYVFLVNSIRRIEHVIFRCLCENGIGLFTKCSTTSDSLIDAADIYQRHSKLLTHTPAAA